MLEIFKNYEVNIVKTIDNYKEEVKKIDNLMEKIRVHINKLDPKLLKNKKNLTLAIRLVE